MSTRLCFLTPHHKVAHLLKTHFDSHSRSEDGQPSVNDQNLRTCKCYFEVGSSTLECPCTNRNSEGKVLSPLISTQWHIIKSHVAATSSSKALALHLHTACSVKFMTQLFKAQSQRQCDCLHLWVCFVLMFSVYACVSVYNLNNSLQLYHHMCCIKQIRICIKNSDKYRVIINTIKKSTLGNWFIKGLSLDLERKVGHVRKWKGIYSYYISYCRYLLLLFDQQYSKVSAILSSKQLQYIWVDSVCWKATYFYSLFVNVQLSHKTFLVWLCCLSSVAR